MRLPPDLQVLSGIAVMAYSSVLMYAAVRRPAWLQHPLLRPRAFRDYPAASKVFSLVGGVFWWVLGACVIWKNLEGM